MSDLTGRRQILCSCSSCCSPVSRFPSRSIRTMHTRDSMGLPNGKTEAWYVLSAAPGAKVALGLNERLTLPQLREVRRQRHDYESCCVANGAAGRHYFRPGRDNSCDRRGTCHRRDSAAQRRDIPHVRSMTGNVSFTLNAQLQWRTADLPICGSYLAGLPTRVRFWSQMRTSFSRGSNWNHTPLGAWRRNEKPGFSLPAAVPMRDRSTLL